MSLINGLGCISPWQQPKVEILGDTLVGLKTEAKDFWREVRDWLDNGTRWDKVKIGDAEISKDRIASFAKLNLLITPSLLARFKITDETLFELIRSKIDPIASAVYLGDIELVRALMLEGACSNLVIEGKESGNFKGYSLLDIAIFSDQLEIFNLLLEQGAAKPNGPVITLRMDFLKQRPVMIKSLVQHGLLEAKKQKDACGRSPLHWAASDGKLDDIKFWLDMGGQIDDLSSTCKETPLQHAVNTNQMEAVLLLLKRGANPTLALGSAFNYQPSFIRILLEHGANPHTLLVGKKSLLQATVQAKDIENFEILAGAYKQADKGHLIDLLTDFLSTKIEFLNTKIYPEKSKDRFEWIRILLDVIDCKNVTIKGLPLLHCLAIYDEKLALYILKGGANPHAITSTGISALHLAAILNRQSLASTLIDMKVDLNVKDYTGATPLNHALNYHKTHLLAVKLIKNGALPHAHPLYLYNSFKLLGIKWLSPDTNRTSLLHAE